MHQRTRRAVAAVAAATLVAGFGAGPAQAAPGNDPTCASAVNGTPAGPTGQSATGYALNVGGASEFGTVHDPAGDAQQASFPSVIAADSVTEDGTPVRRLYSRFGLTLDDPNATPLNGQVESVDGGQTFPAGTYTEDPVRTPALAGVTRLRDGTLLGYEFKAKAGFNTGTQIRHVAFRSTDDGQTWASEDSTFNLTSNLRGGRIASPPLELPDGTILIAIYGTYTDSTNTRVDLQASTDGGRTFTRRAVPFRDNATNAYNETGIAQLPSGKLIAVARHQVPNAVNGKLDQLSVPVWTTSADNGVTWTALQNLQISFPYGYDPYDDTTKQLTAVAPDLKLMPNGVLVLRSGRPDNWVAISTNGQGTGWVGQLVYRNCPSDGARFHGSTGYGGIDYLSANRAVVVGDNCEITWACDEAAEDQFTVDKQTRVWRRWIDVLTPNVGRIDLATKYRKGVITIDSDMTSSVAGHVRARVDGAFDGSTEHWSSAVNTNGAGTYVINLDRQYPLTKIGVALRNGRQASGRVYASTDGVNWGSPLANLTNRTHLAMEYVTLAAPVNARYVKVEADAGADGSSFLNEIELYSSINSFENDPVNNRPRGFSNIVQSWQTQRTWELDDNDSASALVIVDTNPNAMSQVTWNDTASTSKRLEFRLKPLNLLGFLIDVFGKDASGNTVEAYHLAVAQNGSLNRWDGSKWIALTGVGAVKQNTWNSIVVTAGTSTASVQINGETVATNLPYTNRTATLHGYRFASNGTPTVDDKYLVDDVLFTN
ncbi:discoidin domain-containing protein [Actinoplanes sp. NPDC051861]|uniref:discoidin domain-containing protein n=1 Tax=Actinoplanes sp. NPDC051861 TaxID=3155170 RepID=UPI00343147E8